MPVFQSFRCDNGVTQQIASAPTFSPPGGTYSSGQSIAITSPSPGYSIYYTTDGSIPTYPVTGTTQLLSGLLAVSVNETVKAIAVVAGYLPSAVASASYNLVVSTPTFSPAAGTYTGPQTVSINCATPGASIYYTTNGATPTSGSTLYTGPILVSASETVQAIGVLAGWTNSAVGSAAYVINASGLNYPLTMLSYVDAANSANFATTAFQQSNARANLVLLSFTGGYESLGTTIASIMQNMKAYAAANLTPGHSLKTINYRIFNCWFETTSAGFWPFLINTLNAQLGWRLQSSGYPTSANPIVAVSAGETNYWLNNDAVSPNNYSNSGFSVPGPQTYNSGNPVNMGQFAIWHAILTQMQGNGAAIGETGGFVANPYLDGFGIDNMYLMARDNACWDSTSTVYQNAQNGGNPNPPADWQPVAGFLAQGWSQMVAMARTIDPSIFMLGNSDVGAYAVFGQGAIPAAKQNLMDAIVIEAPVGQSYSFGVQFSPTFQQMLTYCMANEPQCKNGPGGCFWAMEGRGNGTYGNWGANQTGWIAADWQGARYQDGCCQLLQWGNQIGATNSTTWFDEWDAGNGSLGWLGTPGTRLINNSGVYQPPNTTASTLYGTHGIITINMPNGCNVYLYPAGAGDIATGSAVTIPQSMLQNGGGHHINYAISIPPTGVTSNAAFTTLTIQPRDAIFTKP